MAAITVITNNAIVKIRMKMTMTKNNNNNDDHNNNNNNDDKYGRLKKQLE